MTDWQAHNDAHSRQVFMAFKEALSPLMANVAPDWLLHHIEMWRSTESDTMDERVEIRLVIKPIGQARFGDRDADLLTGYKRLRSNVMYRAKPAR